MSGLDEYFVTMPPVSTAAAPAAAPMPAWAPGTGRRPTRRSPLWTRRFVVVAASLAVAVAAGVWHALPAPKDTRPIAVPDTLGGQPRTNDPMAAASAAEVQREGATQSWPGRQVAVAFYDGTLPYHPNPVISEAAFRGSSGAHLMVLRGRFGSKGDPNVFDRMAKVLGIPAPPRIRIGPTTCQSGPSIAVCWRESDRLSVSVLHPADADVDQIASEVQEAWAAAR